MLSAILPALHRWHQMELRSHVAARRSPTSPEQRSKWRVRIGGWRWPKAWQQSPSPHSLAHLPLLAYFYAAFVAMFPTTGSSEEATSGRWRTNAEKLARALLSFAKQIWVSLQPPQFAECVSCCIKQHILRFGDVLHVHRPVNSRCRGIKDEERTEGI